MEPSLNAQFKDLQAEVGDFLGYGRGADFAETAWATRQQADITRAVQGGLRMFYYCGYDWSFLRPVTTLTLASGSVVLALPGDVGGIEGQLVISTPQSTSWWPLDLAPIGVVSQKAAELPNTTGRPQLVAIEAIKGTSLTESSRSQLRFWPTADQAYTLKVQYYVHPDYLSGSFPYAYGGPQHAEALLTACLASAERVKDNADPRAGNSANQVAFVQLLKQSQAVDRRNKPQSFGYNADTSDWRHRPMWRHRDGQQPVTVNGVVP